MTKTCAFRGCDEPIPLDAGRGARYHAENCRKAEHRARKAEKEGRVIPLPSAAGNPGDGESAPGSDRYDAARALWDMLIADVAADGFTITGASGAKVAHPALRYLSAVHNTLRDLEAPSSEAHSEDDDIATIKRLALKRVAEINAAEAASWETR
ncbi:hypothetical protein [Streptomyces lycii]|uniref:Terminase small subunit n=1 Tax=Streptomyces lycii TaxID=2654337 RepID=A0ABQ7FPZ8_9ACTN|nr:hypothetical protein [Streptomyces lycii]KAF4410910.1 hypothetical protein GCU69_01435 [Streptomyces lycii]